MKTKYRLWQLTVLFIMMVAVAVHAADVSKEDILNAARKWIADNAVFQAEQPNAIPVMAVRLADGNGQDMPLWRVDLQPAGYLVMSSDDTLPPVVTFNTNGSFELPEDHPLPSMLKRQGEIFQEELGKPKTRGNELAEENQARWNVLLNRTRGESVTPSTIVRSPMLATEWSQDAPFNYFCPSGSSYTERGITGCVATAVAQMLKYHEWPPAGTGTKENADNSGDIQGSMKADFSAPYEWGAMSDSYPGKEERDYGASEMAAARLAMEASVLVGADYGLDGTSAYSHNLNTLMSQYLGYSSSAVYGDTRSGYIGYVAQSTLYSRIRSDMTAGRPAFVSYEGHTFIADGLGTMGSQDYYHFNYGWGGYQNGWYLLTDGYENTVIIGATTNIQPSPVAVFKPVSCEQTSSFTLSWDFPKRLTAEAFRLTKTTGTRASTVISSSISGTARSYTLTGQSGTATYTLEAKVGGSWQAVSGGATVTVKTSPAAMLELSVGDGLKSIAGKQVTMTVTANNTLASLSVTSSRTDILPASGIVVSGSGASRTVRLTPASGTVGNVLLYVTATDAAGNTVCWTAPMAVMADEPLTWHTTKDAAFEAALANGKLVLLVVGRDTCSNTNYFRNTVCETTDVKATLLAGYELWYANVNAGATGYSTYSSGLGNTFPWIAIIDPANSTKRLRGHGAFMSLADARVFLDPYTPYFSLSNSDIFALGTTQTLELSALKSGVEIRYRLDGTAPTTFDTLYSSAISLTATTTVSARSFVDGEPVSDTLTMTYTFLEQVATPVLNVPQDHYFFGSCLVMATCATSGATIRYTTDGYIPTSSSPVLPTGGVSVTEYTAFAVKAFKDGMKESDYSYSILTPYEEFPEAQAIVVEGDVTMLKVGTPWTVQTTTYHSSPSAMQSGAIGNSASTVLAAKVVGPGTVSFQWKVSSQQNYDKLIFSIDGVEKVNISGITEWERMTFSVPGDGDHYLKWTYSKNYSQVAGSDCGWVDDIVWGAISYALTVVNGTGNGYYEPGATVTATADEAPGGQRFGHWEADGMTLTAAQSTAPTLTITIPNNDVTLTAVYEDTDEYAPEADFTYTTANSQVTITGYTGSWVAVRIPPTIGGLPVTVIGNNAFRGNTTVKAVYLPDSVTSIQTYAFYQCSNLSVCHLGGNVASIGNYAFAYTAIKTMTLPDTLTSLGSYAFYFDKALESIVIPGSLKNIRNCTFWNTGLQEIVLSEGVESIGKGAFAFCSFKSLHIPTSLTTMDEGVFERNSSTNEITVAEGNEHFRVMDGVLYSYDMKDLILAPVDVEEFHVPEGVQIIHSDSFRSSTLQRITFPEGLTTIMSDAFYSVRGITEVTLPSTFTTIYRNAFSNRLKTITVHPDNPVLQSIDGVLYSRPATVLVYYPYSNENTVHRIADGVRTIGGCLSNGINVEVDYTVASQYVRQVYLPFTVENIRVNYFMKYGGNNTIEFYFDGRPVTHNNAYQQTYLQNQTVYAWPGLGWEELDQFDGAPITIMEGVNPPAISQSNGEEGRFNGSTTVSMTHSASTDGLVLRYTLDGTTPTVDSPQYTQPFEISEDCTVAARYFKNGEPYSGVGSVDFVKEYSFDDIFADSGLEFENDANYPWTGLQDSTVEGGLAVRSGVIGHSQQTSIQTTVKGKGRVSFFWKVSSEQNYDKLHFYVDGTEVVPAISGTVVWTQVSYDITNVGEHTLAWRYTKDNSASNGDDCGWVADVVWEPAGKVLESIAISGNATIATASTATYTCTATWSDGTTSTETPTWAVSPTTYASVSTTGVVTNKNTTTNDQTVTLTASYTFNGVTKTDSKTITLAKKVLTGISIAGNATIATASTATYTCTATWSDGTTSTETPTWAVSPTTYASVSTTGVVTNKNTTTNDQTVTLTASYTFNGVTKTDSKTITLAKKVLTGISIAGNATIATASTATYTCTATWSYGDATTVTPTWSVSPTTYASVSTTGVVTNQNTTTTDQTATLTASYTVNGVTKTASKTVTLQADDTLTKFAVVVYNGTGDGMFSPGDSVVVTADAPPAGKQFCFWDAGGLTLTESQRTSPTLTFTMPDGAVHLAANFDDNYTPVSAFYYQIVDDEEVTITGYRGYYDDVVIPASIEGRPVTAIGYDAFSNAYITSVVIPEGVVDINSWAFAFCVDLRTIQMPESLMAIGTQVFYNCRALEAVDIPDGVEYIGYGAFAFCESLASVKFPSSLQELEDSVFYDCKSLTSVQIPDNCNNLGYDDYYGDFQQCRALESVVIGNGVEWINPHTFLGCPYLKYVQTDNEFVREWFADNYPYVTIIGMDEEPPSQPYDLVTIDGIVYILKDGVAILADALDRNLLSMEIPSEIQGCPVIAIGDSAFHNCDGLYWLRIPDSVCSIGKNAFTTGSLDDDSVIRALIIGNGVEFIEEDNAYWLAQLDFVQTDNEYVWDWFNVNAPDVPLLSMDEEIPALPHEVGLDRLADETGLVFDTSETAPWRIVDDGGELIARSGVISHLQETLLETTVMGSGTVSFIWKVSSEEGYDKLMFIIDDVVQDIISGESDWEQVSFNVEGDGEHFLTWAYVKDESESYGDDCGMIAEIVWTPDGQTLALAPGWNWVSFNVLPESHKIGDVLGTSGFSVNDIIQTNGGLSRFTGTSWMPGSFTVEYGKLYQIYVANAMTLEISGMACDSFSMPLVSGWNWIGNPTAQTVEPSQLTHSGGWTAGDRIQTAGGASVTYTGGKWIPAGFTLEPGKGYQIYTANEGTLSFP